MCAPGSAKKGPGVRKVLVCGAAFAATCLSVVAVPAGAGASAPTPPVPTTPGVPSVPSGSGAPSGSATPGTTPPATPSAELTPPALPSSPSAPTSSPSADTGGVVSGHAVMVTPKLPRQATYAYGRDPRQRLDAYWRATAKPSKGAAARKQRPRPGVLLLHGGYWLGGDKGGWKYFARRLTAQGFTVFAANYRLSASARWPAQRNDAETALAFVKKHAKAWNLDPNRIVVLGSSSGGQLATQLGTVGEGARRVRGVVALSPPNNPYLAFQDGAAAAASASRRKLRGAVIRLLGCMPAVTDPLCWKRVDDANSASHASAGDAPMLLMHSTGDFVPVTESTGLASALRLAGVPVTVKRVPGTMHSVRLLNDETVYPEILAWIKARTR
jgi:acetyl esterase/lipase